MRANPSCTCGADAYLQFHRKSAYRPARIQNALPCDIPAVLARRTRVAACITNRANLPGHIHQNVRGMAQIQCVARSLRGAQGCDTSTSLVPIIRLIMAMATNHAIAVSLMGAEASADML